MRKIWILMTAFILLGAAAAQAAPAGDVVVGVNVVGVDQARDQQQDALIANLQRYGVKTIRTALGGERYTSFVIKAYQHGIDSLVMVDPCAGSNRKHALPPDAAAGRWRLRDRAY